MSKTLFVAGFPDLSSFDFSKTNIKVGEIDNSEFLVKNNFFSISSYMQELKKMIGKCDIIFLPINDKVISNLSKMGINCIVLYPDLDIKNSFLKELRLAKVEEDFISTIEDSWDFVISRLMKKNFKYEYVLKEEDNVLDVLKFLLEKRNILGVSFDDVSLNEDIVDDIFYYCLLREDEFLGGKPKVDSIFCEGIKFDCFFSLQRLKEKKNNISLLIDSIKAVDQGISVKKLGILKDGSVWTDSDDIIEKIMVLGIGNGDLILPFSRQFDNNLKDCVPYVIKKEVLQRSS